MSGGPEGFADPGNKDGTDRPWRMEDLEGELERKVEQLEKERKALRLETEKHRQEIDQGISKLHHRISGLEEGKVLKERKQLRNNQNVCAHFNV